MRWSSLELEKVETAQLPGMRDPATIRRFDAPEALDTRFYEIRSKSVLNKVPEASQAPFRWTVNPYRGCSHACTYCFARPTHTFLGMNAGRDFEREIVVKTNAPEVLRADLARRDRAGRPVEHVALGTNTDPYQWVESKYRLMPGIWEALRDFATPGSVLTKSPLLLRDVALMREIDEVAGFEAALSVPSLDERAWRTTEPRTPHPRKRLEAVAALNEAGIATSVLVAPLMPGINDSPEQLDALLRACAEAGAVRVGGIGLHLRGETRDVFLGWLREARPELVEEYEGLYGRYGAYLPPGEQARLQDALGMATRTHAPDAVPRPLAPHLEVDGRGRPRGHGAATVAVGTSRWNGRGHGTGATAGSGTGDGAREVDAASAAASRTGGPPTATRSVAPGGARRGVHEEAAAARDQLSLF